MNKTLEEQAIDNERHLALMAAIICAGLLSTRIVPSLDDEAEGTANYSVSLAKAILKEAGK